MDLSKAKEMATMALSNHCFSSESASRPGSASRHAARTARRRGGHTAVTRPHRPAAALTSGDAPGKSPRQAERAGEPGSLLPVPPPPPPSAELSLARSPLVPPSLPEPAATPAAGPGPARREGAAALPRPPPARTKAGPAGGGGGHSGAPPPPRPRM